MKLLRLATIYFSPIPKGWRSWELKLDSTMVQTVDAQDIEKRLRLIIAAEVDLADRPALTDEGYIIVPEEPRKQAELAIETAANLIAVAERCKRVIASPSPCIAFVPENPESRDWLDTTTSFKPTPHNIPSFKFSIDTGTLQKSVADRLDGLALLAEALTHDHTTGKFHEFMRLFERAFGESTEELVNPLARFLMGAGLGYSHDEVRKWVVDLRHLVTHADRRQSFALESDVRPVIRRVEQAAYDVLFNKAQWQTPSINRRRILSPPAGTRSDRNDLFVVKGSTGITLEGQLLDEFGAYPLDLDVVITQLPNGWWSKHTVNNNQQDNSGK